VSFRKELLLPAKSFFEREIGHLSRPDRKGWMKGHCPFHQSKSGKSFSVHVDGHFYCHGCGVKGGDVVNFLRLRDRMGFKETCKALGAWGDDEKQKQGIKIRRGPLVSYLVFEFEVDGVPLRAELEDQPRTELEQLRRFAAEATDRLHEIRNGDAERFPNEEAIQWAILSQSWELIEMEVRNG
jgi:CHC2 zinc finger